ncbi:MAG: hypothetical protein NWR72_09140 [Bacteroidia bacterium]|nr:hypothetical protein [Bacteroidia bacterium]
MRNYLNLSWLFLLLLCSPTLRADDDTFMHDGVQFHRWELPVYRFAELTPQVALRTEYAQHTFQNPGDWILLKGSMKAYEIDLVFTKYPENIDKWRTNYYDLLSSRLKTLFELDSTLRNANIKWNMVLQTQCKTEEEAINYFHGFVIKYHPRKIPFIDQVKSPDQLRMLISGEARVKDSTVFQVMERHPEWNDMLVVMDWTGSMYQHGAQLVLWHKLHLDRTEQHVAHFVFFNDGNSKKTWQKKPGKTGGVYHSRTADLEEIVETMTFVMSKGNGGDPEENDLEAVLTGQQYLSDFGSVILIADNKSDVRDMELLGEISHPVHIILCDVQNGEIHPHYQEIAEKTGGSIHTLTQDLSFAPAQ